MLEVADAVHRRQRGDGVRGRHPLGDLAEPVERGRVRGVLEVADRPVVVVVAHRPDEQRHAPVGRVLDGREHLAHVERGLPDVEQAHHGSAVVHPATLRRAVGAPLTPARGRLADCRTQVRWRA